MHRTTPGMVIGIPVSESGDMRAAKVLFCSKRYRNVVLVAFSDHPRVEPGVVEFIPTAFNGRRVYTGALAIGARWPILGHSALTETEKGASLRIIAGEVWVADELVRPASPQDLSTVPTMSVAGAGLVEKWAKQ
jgi:hypothetical protein